jgi:hypothetical protein
VSKAKPEEGAMARTTIRLIPDRPAAWMPQREGGRRLRGLVTLAKARRLFV